jgi:hypothetical protein
MTFGFSGAIGGRCLANDWDIAGIELGMPMSVVQAKIQAAGGTNVAGTATFERPEGMLRSRDAVLPSMRFGIVGRIGRGGSTGLDSFTVVNDLPGQNRVLAVMRATNFTYDKEPQLDVFEHVLVSKYGDPNIVYNPGRLEKVYVWASNGSIASRSYADYGHCHSFVSGFYLLMGPGGGLDDPADQRQLNCGKYLSVTVDLDPWGRVSIMRTDLVDHEGLRASYDAVWDALDRGQGEADRQRAGNRPSL